MTDGWFEPVPAEPAPANPDTGVPHIARVYGSCLGGKDNAEPAGPVPAWCAVARKH